MFVAVIVIVGLVLWTVFIFAFCHFSIKAAMESWAKENGLRIASWKWHFLSFAARSPFARKFRMYGGATCHLTVEDTEGNTRRVWVRMQQTLWNPIGKIAEVVWDE